MGGHGHVTPNADGSKARCGGPGICAQCSREAAAKPAKSVRTITLSAMIPGSQEDCQDCRTYANGVTSSATSGDLDEAAEYIKDLSNHIAVEHKA